MDIEIVRAVLSLPGLSGMERGFTEACLDEIEMKGRSLGFDSRNKLLEILETHDAS